LIEEFDVHSSTLSFSAVRSQLKPIPISALR